MGQSIIEKHVGAYFKIDMPNDEFREKLDELNFGLDFDCDEDVQPKFKHFYYELFLSPYQGLEYMPILLPFTKDENKPVAVEFSYDDECEVECNFDFGQFIENLKETYADEIADMQLIFGDKLQIKSGVVCYRDEIG